MQDTNPPSSKRVSDKIASTIVAVAIVGGTTVLGLDNKVSSEGVLAGYGLAAAIAGVPVVVKRSNGKSE